MTRNLPEPKPETRPSLVDAKQRAYAALEALLERVGLHKISGPCYVRLDCKQGGVMAVRISTEEIFEPNLKT